MSKKIIVFGFIDIFQKTIKILIPIKMKYVLNYLGKDKLCIVLIKIKFIL